MEERTFRYEDGRVADNCDHSEFGLNDDLRFFCLACGATAKIPDWHMPPIGSLVHVTIDLVRPGNVGRVGVVTKHLSPSHWDAYWMTLVDDGSPVIVLKLITWTELVQA